MARHPQGSHGEALTVRSQLVAQLPKITNAQEFITALKKCIDNPNGGYKWDLATNPSVSHYDVVNFLTSVKADEKPSPDSPEAQRHEYLQKINGAADSFIHKSVAFGLGTLKNGLLTFRQKTVEQLTAGLPVNPKLMQKLDVPTQVESATAVPPLPAQPSASQSHSQ